MATIEGYVRYLYARQADLLHRLKTENLSFTEHTKYAYVAPTGKTFRNNRPSQALIDSGWKYAKVTYKRFSGAMNPKHPRWPEYRQAKREATVLLAARLILKATGGHVTEKAEVSRILGTGLMRHHARTSSEQKRLAYRAFHRLRKLDNRLRSGRAPEKQLDAWCAGRRALPHISHSEKRSEPRV